MNPPSADKGRRKEGRGETAAPTKGTPTHRNVPGPHSTASTVSSARPAPTRQKGLQACCQKGSHSQAPPSPELLPCAPSACTLTPRASQPCLPMPTQMGAGRPRCPVRALPSGVPGGGSGSPPSLPSPAHPGQAGCYPGALTRWGPSPAGSSPFFLHQPKALPLQASGLGGKPLPLRPIERIFPGSSSAPTPQFP